MLERKESAPFQGGPPPEGPGPVVGIGASAGGLAALRRFFGATPEHGGVTYVVVLHLDPERESQLAHILSLVTSMPVEEVLEETEIEPDHVYVISPKSQLEIENGILRALPLPSEIPRLTIDRFFRSLAATHGANAVGVVLSGSGRDGALGLRAIREQGGITATQAPFDAEFPEMPRSAQDEGGADLVLPAGELPVELLRILRGEEVTSVDEEELPDEAASAVEQIILRMEEDVGHNLRHYKRPTVLRRLHRRMRFCRSGSIPEYAHRIDADPQERRALFQDLLISVSRFFRDPEAFEVLEREVVPRLFEEKTRADQIRVWVPGCATGEEAYSLAMLLHERAADLPAPPEVPVFASDIDERALEFARRGHYPASIEEDVPRDRLARFFREDRLGYQVLKPLRDSVLFASQGVLTDPPFARLDLVSCRNLLIYLQPRAQREVMERFHYALRPGGYLFLGVSESATSDLFEPVARKQRIYRRLEARLPVPSLRSRPWGSGQFREARWTDADGRPEGSRSPPARSLHERVLLQVAPPSALVDAEHQVVHLSQGVGRYLRLPAGSPTTDLRELVREPFASHIQTALYQALQGGQVSRRVVEVELEGQQRTVELVVYPASEEGAGLALVLFQERSAPSASDPPGGSPHAEPQLRELEEELRRTREQLRIELEEREAIVEEFTAANEELQSMNEEHQATAEELETRGEELQSLNEELTTLNQEHQATIEELAEVTSHLANLLESIRIAMIVLDRDLRIRRFTKGAPDLFNLLPSDENRPFAHITHNLDYDGDIVEDARRALITHKPVQREVQAEEQYYIVRLIPYRPSADQIDGVIIICFDITDRKEMERTAERAQLRAEEEQARLLSLMEQMPAGVVIAGCASREILITNRRSREILVFGERVSSGEVGGVGAPDRLPEFLDQIVEQVVETGGPVLDQLVPLHDQATFRDLLVSVVPLPDRDGGMSECILTLVDVEEILGHARELEERAERTRGGFLATISHELRTPLNAITGYAELLLLGIPDQLTEDQERHVRRLQACAEQLATMVGQILTLTQLGEGETKLTPRAVDPRDPLMEAVTFLEPERVRRGIDLLVEVPDERTQIVTDPGKLRQVLFNLAHNAVKFTPEGDVVLSLEHQEDRGVVFEVRDSGIGIAPEDRERIFERFWQARSADHPTGAAGAGVGLAVVKSLVQLLDGTVEVESEPGLGSTFRVRLPAALKAAVEPPVEPTVEEDPGRAPE